VNRNPIPITLDELALGAFLHDIGKLLQRAGGERDLPERVRSLEGEILPTDGRSGRYTHRHTLLTAGFFDWWESERLPVPDGVDRERVRRAAVYHHKPDDALPFTWIVTEADRMASGMERKARDLAQELDTAGRGAFRTTPLLALQTRAALGGGRKRTAPGWYRARPLSPEAILPGPQPSAEDMAEGYAACSRDFLDGFRILTKRTRQAEHFHDALISLSERTLWSIPSSTVDEPDISLHDHSLAVAAIAACLHRWHERDGSLEDLARIKDRDIPKFRLLEGDLSGIQSTLFRLASEQVRGVNRILRARSFLMAAIAETAAILLRRRMELPSYCLLLRAGGKFTMLLPAEPDLEARIEALQAPVDRELCTAYAGDLALNLALGDPFPGSALMRGAWPATWRHFRERVEERKLHPLATVMTEPVLAQDYAEGADGDCPACGVRPRKPEYTSRVDGISRCLACHREHELGRDLPKAKAVLWAEGEDSMPLLAEFSVRLLREVPARLRRDEAAGFVPWSAGEAEPTALPRRFLANHVPTFVEGEWDEPRYRDVIEDPEDIDRLREDAIKTMAHLAREDCRQRNGGFIGRPMLAVLKADVDRLGQIFTRGFPSEDRTIGRTVALSRLMDAFFTGHLTHLLETDETFRNIYTVYAGGDDLLLIGPWWTTVRFAMRLREAFRCFAGGNPDLTLSAGIAFVSPRQPLNRAARDAEARLEAAKNRGRNRVCLVIEEPIGWDALQAAIETAEWLDGLIAQGRVPDSFLYKLLQFADMKAEAERRDGPVDLEAAMWNARFSYHLARQFPKEETLREQFRELIGLPGAEPAVPARIPLTLALYRNR